MAITATEATFTAAVTNRSDRVEIIAPGGEGPTGARYAGANALVPYAESDASSGSATVEVFVTELNTSGVETVIWSRTLTIAVGSKRTLLAGSSGNYLCTVSDDVTYREFVDIAQHVGGLIGRGGTKLYMSCVALTTIASLRMRMRWTRAI